MLQDPARRQQNGAACHIVVLEDNRGDFYLIERSLRESGLDCEITSFADGGTALDFVNRAIILDLNVPGTDGRSVLEAVRWNPRWSDVPVFAFTASQAPKDMARMKELGTDCYLIKPVELAGFATFGQRIKAWLENRQQAAPALGETHTQGQGSRI